MTKYIVLSEYANLNGISESKSEVYQTYTTGDNTIRKHLLPSFMLERGAVFEVDLEKMSNLNLTTLCEKEGCLAIVRIDTNYNQEAKKQGLEADLYKIKIGNETKFYNTVRPQAEITGFCQNWEDKKAYILNSQYARYYLPLIDKFYLGQIQKNNQLKNK